MGCLPPFLAQIFLCQDSPHCSPPVSFQRQPVSAYCCNQPCFLCWWSFSRVSATPRGTPQGWVWPSLDLQPAGIFARSVTSLAVWSCLLSKPETRSRLLSLGLLLQGYCCAHWLAHPRCSEKRLWLTDWCMKGLFASNRWQFLERTSHTQPQHRAQWKRADFLCLPPRLHQWIYRTLLDKQFLFSLTRVL